jgi:hypothetical protein
MDALKWRLAAPLLVAVIVPGTALSQQPRRVVLDDAGRVSLSAGITARVRAESWSNFAFGTPPAAPATTNDQTFGLLRVMPHVRLDVADRLTVFVQAKAALTTGRELAGGDRPIDEDRFDIQQAYARLTVPVGRWRLALSGGREDLTFGRERLIGPLDWGNSRRTFQGASVVVSSGPGSARLFWVRPVQVRQLTWNIPDSTRQVFGVSLACERPRFGIEAYWLGAHTDVARFNSTTAADRRSTVGARVFTRGPARRGGFDVEIEAAYQFGAFGTADVGAYMIASQAGWRPTAATRVYLGFDLGTGDDSTTGKLRTFNQLYPTGHLHLGYADVHGRQNVVDLSWGASALVRRATVVADVHNIWRASAKDGLYGVDGTQTRAAGTGLATRVGTEVDLTLRYPLRRDLPLQAGYSIYLPDRYLEQSGRSETMHFGYVQVGWTW